MPRKGQPKNYHEPWTATVSPSWDSCYRNNRPTKAESPESLATAIELWEAEKAAAKDHAPWIIWGSGIWEPCVCTNLNGSITVMGDAGIIAIQDRATKHGRTDQAEYAQRIAACVTACAGISDPIMFVEDARKLLLEMVRGEYDSDPRSDARIVSLLSRCIPPAEFEKFSEEDL